MQRSKKRKLRRDFEEGQRAVDGGMLASNLWYVEARRKFWAALRFRPWGGYVAGRDRDGAFIVKGGRRV